MVVQRYIESSLLSHLDQYRQMAFLHGPRQVGKTTVAQHLMSDLAISHYLSWDDTQHRTRVLQDYEMFIKHVGLDVAGSSTSCAIDEIHKRHDWRDFLKSVYDTYPNLRLLITGSAMLTQFSRGGDSLAGRYFPYTLYPLSVAEIAQRTPAGEEHLIHSEPKEVSNEEWEALLRFGGYPEPFLRASTRFHLSWQDSWMHHVLVEDVRDLTRVQEISKIEKLALILTERVASQTSYASLARTVGVAQDTIPRWLETLKALYFCFAITPWHTNVERSLRKEPKIYLWDWSKVQEDGARYENLVALTLLKTVTWWTEMGYGRFSLHHLRDKDRREVDFVVIRDRQPLLLVDVKASHKQTLSKNLGRYQEMTKAPYAVQVAFDAPYYDVDSVRLSKPTIVSARSFLSQLV